MILCSCFLGYTSMCDILLFLVCVLVNCPRGEYELCSLRFQGFLVHCISVQSGCRPVCCSFSDGTCNSLPCSTSNVCSVCEVDSCPWYELVVRVCVEGVGVDEGCKCKLHDEVEARLMLRPQWA